MRTIGTVVRGVRAPIFRAGDDVVAMTAETVLNALKDNGITPRDKDVVAVTESVVARCQGNYATVEQIAAVSGITQKDAEAVWQDLHGKDTDHGREEKH